MDPVWSVVLYATVLRGVNIREPGSVAIPGSQGARSKVARVRCTLLRNKELLTSL